MLDVDRGFDPRGLLTMRVPQPPQTTFAKRMTLLDRLQPRLAGLPTVTDVAFGNALPFVTVGGYRGMDMALPRDPSTKVDVQTAMRVVSPEYFRAMRLRVLQGRPLDASDIETSAQTIVVNRTFAAQYLGGRPVGQRLNLGLANVRRGGGRRRRGRHATRHELPASPTLHVWRRARSSAGGDLPARIGNGRFPIDDLIVVVRSSADPAALAADARALIGAEDPTLPVDSVMTMEDRVAASLAGPRSYAVFLVGVPCVRW